MFISASELEVIVSVLPYIFSELNQGFSIAGSEGALVAAVGHTYIIKSKSKRCSIRHWMSKSLIKKPRRNEEYEEPNWSFPFLAPRKLCLVFWCSRGWRKRILTWNGFTLNTLNNEPNFNCYCTFWAGHCVTCFMVMNWLCEVVQQRKSVKFDFQMGHCWKCSLWETSLYD